MGDRDWGRWQVILGSWQVVLAIIAIGLTLIGLVFQLTPETPKTGSISVSSSPVGASVYLDGNYKGEVPQFLNDIEQGTHSITLKLEGYDDWYEDISVDADKTVSVSPTLTPTESSKDTSDTSKDTSDTSKDTSANSAFISDSENVKIPTSVDISPYLEWSFTTSDSASYITVPEGYSYVTVTIHIKNDGNVPISTDESCWKFISNGDTYDYCEEDISIALHRNYEMLEVNPGEETTFKIPYLVEGEPTTASLSYINPYTDI
ncbi:hypothetical protein ASJ81_09825 [Methanosarcina spelaei]|uniref:PEGA domain-containing protein n=1 Tax=Methanosarcina spelaei TaxID=1036679 RepID=A0A2A2HQJ9_9EURY|nr:PEGA domain-containing protein [Methanosarcina spelaei]PAV11556.1 hypothetical protein ASJ81_09825 [Methanosarcina spelaei]